MDRLPRRILAVSGFVAPAALALLGMTVLAGGCAKEGGGSPIDNAASIVSRAPLSSGHAKIGRAQAGGGERGLGSIGQVGARTLSVFANTGGSLIAAGGSASLAGGTGRGIAIEPLDQLLRDGDRPLALNGLCPPDMASIDDLYCVDKYESSLVEILPNGDERGWSPFIPVEGHVVRAVSEAAVYPQGYISGNQAAEACARSGKRLCKPREWTKACMGPDHSQYGYGSKDEPRRCNDHGKSPVIATYGASGDLGNRGSWNWEKMNDPSLNQLDDTLARTGEFEGCENGYGLHDMVGNLHEWVADPNGTFQGGYYQDTHENGDGCSYKTMAHAAWYHDYSTGFRCCADPAP